MSGLSHDRQIGQAGTVVIGALPAVWFGLSALTPAATDVVFGASFGAAALLGALRACGGCEVVAFPNAVAGRRDGIGSIFTPIDAVEVRYRAHRGLGTVSSR
jgi:hypothetical protein